MSIPPIDTPAIRNLKFHASVDWSVRPEGDDLIFTKLVSHHRRAVLIERSPDGRFKSAFCTSSASGFSKTFRSIKATRKWMGIS